MRILLQNRFEKIMFYEALNFGQFESVVISSPLDRSPNRAEATPRPRPQVVVTKNICFYLQPVPHSSLIQPLKIR